MYCWWQPCRPGDRCFRVGLQERAATGVRVPERNLTPEGSGGVPVLCGAIAARCNLAARTVELPPEWLGDRSDGIGQLSTREISVGELVPPVASDAAGRAYIESGGWWSGRGIDQAYRD